MRIVNSTDGDPMLLGSREELSGLYQSFCSFLASEAPAGEFHAATSGSPAPYDQFLRGLRVAKCDGEATLSISSDQWLELRGSSTALARFGEKLPVERDGGHRHWYGSPVSLIIEALDDWEGAGAA